MNLWENVFCDHLQRLYAFIFFVKDVLEFALCGTTLQFSLVSLSLSSSQFPLPHCYQLRLANRSSSGTLVPRVPNQAACLIKYPLFCFATLQFSPSAPNSKSPCLFESIVTMLLSSSHLYLSSRCPVEPLRCLRLQQPLIRLLSPVLGNPFFFLSVP